MAEYQEKYPLDYRVGGDTLDDFAQKYMQEIPRMYQFLNNVRGLNSEGSEQVEPTKYQLKAEDDKLYIRNKENTAWVYLGKVAECLGFTPSADTPILTEADVATTTNEPNKLLRTNASGLLDINITGNAAKIAEKIIETDGLSDGDILVYRVSSGKFVNESKGTIGAGKELILQANGDTLGTYSGDAQTTINIPGISVLQRNKAYAVGDIAYSASLPSYLRLECVTAGTTGASEPDFSTPPMDSRIGLYITDGTVTWIVDDVRDGTPVGSIRGSLYLPKGYIKANGATVNRADYPRLIKWINDNNLWTDDTISNLGLFGKGDGNTTFVLPNFSQRYIQYKDESGKSLSSGLPNITGDFFANDGNSLFWTGTKGANGAFNTLGTMLNVFSGTTITSLQTTYAVQFDAAHSNAQYGATDVVQPPSITLIPIIRY